MDKRKLLLLLPVLLQEVHLPARCGQPLDAPGAVLVKRCPSEVSHLCGSDTEQPDVIPAPEEQPPGTYFLWASLSVLP